MFWVTWGLISACILYAFVWARGQVAPAEDAVILYEYARTWASTGVITYGGAGVPIEGATDFLWMALIAGLKALHVDEFLSSCFLNGCAAVFMLCCARGVGGKSLTLLGLLLTPYLYASASGFSAIFFSAAFVLLLTQRDAAPKRFYGVLLLLCLIRPDGVVWGGAAILWRLCHLPSCSADGLRADVRAAMAYFVLPGVAYFVWRWWYFQEFLPLPFLVKAVGHRDWVLFFSASAKEIWPAVVPCLIALLAWRQPWARTLSWLLFILVPACFYASMRLEQNIGNRFLAPLFFGVLYLMLAQKALRPAVVFVAMSIYAIWPLTMQAISDVVQSKNENVLSISRSIAAFPGTMLTTEAGRLAYYSGWSAHDSWGLNTPKFSRTGVREGDVRGAASYDLIVGHCDINLYRSAQPWSVSAEKTWENQCRVLANRVHEGGYTVFLVPFMDTVGAVAEKRRRKAARFVQPADANCRRHDVYAIRNEFRFSAQIQSILLAHGAKLLDGVADRIQKDLLCAPADPT